MRAIGKLSGRRVKPLRRYQGRIRWSFSGFGVLSGVSSGQAVERPSALLCPLEVE